MSGARVIPLLVMGCVIIALVVAPSFSGKIAMGSQVTGNKISLSTSTSDRFVSSSGKDPVEMMYRISVTEYTPAIPSQGSVTAYTKGSILEGREDSPDLYQTTFFYDITSVSGTITKFEKLMSYSSGFFYTG